MPHQSDDIQRIGERAAMVEDQLRRRGIRSPRVLEAMREVPRELFVPAMLGVRAYDDAALPVDCEQTISQPYMVARMTELLNPDPADRVLEIGTGTGYQTAVLARLVAHVYTIEWHLKLLTEATERLRDMGVTNVSFRCGDGSQGWPEKAPFDAIMVTAGAPHVPTALREQLADNGRLIIPVGPADDQELLRIRRHGDRFEEEEVLRCRFVKLRGEDAWRE